MKIEICIDNIESALNAQSAGADRLELCGSLALGGVTPPYSLIKKTLQLSHIPCYVMIRPRAGDFLFNRFEIEMMVEDIQLAKQLGVSGIVIGVLDSNGDIDLPTCKRLIQAADGLGITFHRAFDLCRNPIQALEQLIDLGCERILTSGQASNALQGAELIKKLVQQANGRISIMAGAGINSANALQIAQQTGVEELHLSAKMFRLSKMKYHSAAVMGNNAEQDQKIWISDKEQIRVVKNLFLDK